MNRTYFLYFFCLIAVIALESCLEPPEVEGPDNGGINEMEQLTIPQGFEFGMSYVQEVTLVVKNESEIPMSGVLFSIYTAPLAQGGKLLGKGVTGPDGSFTNKFELPFGKEALYVYTQNSSLPSAQRLELTGEPIVHEWGSQAIPQEGVGYRLAQPTTSTFTCQTGFYQSFGGQLKSLDINTGTLTTIGSASLRYDAMGYNQEDGYIYALRQDGGSRELSLWRIDNTGSETDLGVIPGTGSSWLNMNEVADFDGNGNLCTVGYSRTTRGWFFISIDVDQQPLAMATQPLTAIGLVYPFKDMAYSAPLNKYYAVDMQGHLIRIDPVGLTMERVADMSDIPSNFGRFIAAWFDVSGNFLFCNGTTGDIYRVTLDGNGDYVNREFVMTGEPESYSDGASCPAVSSASIDTDGDGVDDESDSFPNDPTRVYTDYVPAQGSFGTYAFEDKWPQTGDYDFNDLVIDYSYEYYRNAQNQITSMRANLTTRIVGAAYQLGFGFQLDDLSPSDITSVGGTEVQSILVEANGVESSQSKPVIVVLDNIHQSMGSSPGNFINVGEGETVDQYTVSVTIDFSTPIADVGTINPFIFTQNNRANEIHLKGFSATDKANTSLFGTQDDSSSGTDTYQTATGLPWGLNFPEMWTPPQERTILNDAYPDFPGWVSSNGNSKADWYVKLKARADRINTRSFFGEGGN